MFYKSINILIFGNIFFVTKVKIYVDLWPQDRDRNIEYFSPLATIFP